MRWRCYPAFFIVSLKSRYAKSDSLPMPLGGLGIAIISTSSGLMTQKECLDRGIGGEIVAYVW